MTRNARGFTVVEVIVALVVLMVGVLALVGSSGMVSRMIGRGKVSTFVAQIGEQRLEQLRAAATSTTPPCTSGSFASGTTPATALTQNVAEVWTVQATGLTRLVKDSLMYITPQGTRSVVVSTFISCF